MAAMCTGKHPQSLAHSSSPSPPQSPAATAPAPLARLSPAVLPDLILVSLLDWLDTTSLLCLTQLDRAWRHFVHHSDCATPFWRHRIAQDCPLYGRQLLSLLHSESSPTSPAESLATLYFLARRQARIYTHTGTSSSSSSSSTAAPRSLPSPSNLHLLAASSSILRVFTSCGQIDMYDAKTLEHLDTCSASPLLHAITVYQGSDWIICDPRHSPAILMLDDGSEHVLTHPGLAPANNPTYASGVGPVAWVYLPTRSELVTVGVQGPLVHASVAVGVDMLCVGHAPLVRGKPVAVALAGNGGVYLATPQLVWYAHPADNRHGIVVQVDGKQGLDCRACASPSGDSVLLFAHGPQPGVYDLIHWTPSSRSQLPTPVLRGVRDAGFSSNGESAYVVLAWGMVQRVRVGTWQVEEASVFDADERVVYASYLGGLGVYVVVPVTGEAVCRRRESARCEAVERPVKAMFSVM